MMSNEPSLLTTVGSATPNLVGEVAAEEAPLPLPF